MARRIKDERGNQPESRHAPRVGARISPSTGAMPGLAGPVGQINENRIFLFVAACFLLSGFAALIYQAAWLKKLSVVFGTSHTAVATVLAAYMGGLAFGAALASRFAPTVKRPILLYGILEGAVALTALLAPLMLDGAQALLVLLFGGQPEPASAHGFGQSAYYLASTFIILLVPTGAMGATLPILARYAVLEDSQIGPRIGLLYGINTLGAVAGALAAGFLLLPYLGLFGALAVGAVVNLIVFLIAVLLSRSIRSAAIQDTSASATLSKDDIAPRSKFHWIMPVMLVSGAVAFTLEVLWTRLLTHIFGGTVYAFAVMLACFLTGIALGGLAAGRIASDRHRAIDYFVGAQMLIGIISFCSYMLMSHWAPDMQTLTSKALYAFAVITPATLFIGATYPLAVRIGTDKASDAPSISGEIYAWNTVGAILGALLTGYFVLPEFGFGPTLKIAISISAALALISTLANRRVFTAQSGLIGALFIATLVAINPPRPDKLIYAAMRNDIAGGTERFYGVGRSATIVMNEAQGFFNLSSNGLSESSIGRKGMPPFNLSQKWLAGLPALARPAAESMLIIGYGGGVAIEGAPPSIRRIDVIELEPLVIRANEAIVKDRGDNPLDDPRVRLTVNDARNAMMLTKKRYDIIVSQPSHPWTGGAAHLYTAEFLSLSKSRLNEGGVFLQWINSQFLDEALLKTLMSTLTAQFAHVELYQPERQVLMFVASDSPIDIWDGEVGAEIALEKSRRHFNRMGLRVVEDAIAMTALSEEGVRALAKGSPQNTDNRNLLSFFSRPSGDGLDAESLQTLFQEFDPITAPYSDLPGVSSDRWNAPYVAEQLLSANFIQRSYHMARAAKSPDVKAVIDGLGHYHSDELEKAEASFAAALAANGENDEARFALLRMYLGAFAERRLPESIAKLANQEVGPERRVLEGWVYGAAGAFDRLEQLDSELAAVSPTSLAYPIAVKLRVDWRVVAAQLNQNPAIARDALEILDDLLASYWNLDLYILRSGAAFTAGDEKAFIESVATVTRQIAARLDQEASGDGAFSPAESANLKMRLDGMLDRLSAPAMAPHKARADDVAEDLAGVIARL